MARDIVEIFEEYSVSKNYFFTHGTRNVLNLLQVRDAIEPNKIYLLSEDVKRESEIGDMGLSRNAKIFTGRYLIAYHDDKSTHVYNENNSDVNQSKYKTKIKPLFVEFDSLESQLISCEGYDILSHSFVEAYNIFDGNLTGLFCTYKIRAYDRG